MIGIIDYGMGNLFSVSKALERLDAPYFISEDKDRLLQADALILPGVGAFKDAMEKLKKTGLSEMISVFVDSGRPLLGICLGMQLLFESSEEYGYSEGLNLLPGKVVRFPGITGDGTAYKVPHMGWNKLHFKRESLVTPDLNDDFVYFVHSYYAETKEDVIIASCSYDKEVPAVVGRNNVFGMQFHPEKSSKLGMQLLSNFANLIQKG
ncbi:imidazole glycerol phosphate synthase subunit HisH [Niallia circulans]|jgi:imidazole glycerol-phosphate synthase subunit HisH|nr:imidazole glycerol phosphate synthase subunit HisH [Niallia circulans]MCM2982079.1 imidazole glycerol phosphate synthase subunit HisH [Niallia circulans]MDR4318501.1 imidazole glycerol phosphate synthase subunit HisH [Niallia circulans]MED3841420.1 imidazole glycerol phosphate synthase subunit HisH [Niallia circulans]MED4243483.1 imidazole glycerol phosphate synthase subunit HisH [Niallia circulans]MED4248466.1 imidazole glycerol phosphate synthase subunit HisH [Niallia circulans]